MERNIAKELILLSKQLFRNDWDLVLAEEMEKPYYQELREFLKEEYARERIHPDMEDIFNALRQTAFKDVKAVILGQDPYHGPGQAHGLSFSVQPGVRIPPSLRNIFKELEDDLGCQAPGHGNLTEWTEEGVLLLNTVLTVREGQAHSHRGKGWEIFTDRVIRSLNERKERVVFILWGKPAQSKIPLIDQNKHRIITSVHPSPLSARRGFFGSRPFSRVNQYLMESGQAPVNWQISERPAGK